MDNPTPLFERAAARYQPADLSIDAVLRRHDRRRRNQRIRAGALGLAIAIAVGWWGIHEIRMASDPGPATPDESVDLGIFEAVEGRILYYSDPGLSAVDPSAPSPVSSVVRLGSEGTADAGLKFASRTGPIGWSSDGTELLFVRQDPTDHTYPYAAPLYILHADGTETQLTRRGDGAISGATISPDGTRVVFGIVADSFETGRQRLNPGLYVVGADGSPPVRIAVVGEEPTFSPDGTRIAYVVNGSGPTQVWIADADGTDAHQVLVGEPALAAGVFGLRWSPAGDRIAIWNSAEGSVAIYTFAPDGSAFTKVIDGGFNPYWSPDGTEIAYVLPGVDGLVIADADGSNVRTFPFASSGPWHPGGN